MSCPSSYNQCRLGPIACQLTHQTTQRYILSRLFGYYHLAVLTKFVVALLNKLLHSIGIGNYMIPCTCTC